MSFNQRFFITLLNLLVSCAVIANEKQGNEQLLLVNPKICIVEKVGDSCEVKLKIKWQSLLPLSRCLYQNEEQNVCWYKKLQVSQAITFEIDESQNFSLLDEKNEVLALQQVKLNTHEPKKYRRRLRADWSLF